MDLRHATETVSILNARIPNYTLQRAHDENPVLHSVPVLSLSDGLRAVRLKLWDERQGKLVTFAQARFPGRPSLPALPLRLSFLKERPDALLDVLGREGDGQL